MRLIDADELPKYTGYALSADEVAMAVENAPTVDPVKHGRWIREPDMRGNISDVVWSCSVCGKPKQWYTTNYCPNCGAYMMDGDKNE